LSSILPAGILLIVLLWAGIGLCGASGAVGLAPKSLDVILALDNSGSMRQNDPKGLLREVVVAFGSQLPPDARLGIVGFDEKVQGVLSLTGVSAPDFKGQVSQALAHIDYRGKRTDIPAGVERALYELREQGRPKAERVIVVLTDGVVDLGNPAKDLERARWLREDLAREAKGLGIRIFGVAFTEGADFELMQSVGQTTGGMHFRVLSASDIPNLFDRIAATLVEIAREPGTPKVEEPLSSNWGPWALAIAALLLCGIVAILALRRSRVVTPAVRIPAATLRACDDKTSQRPYRLTKPVTRIGREPAANDIVIPHDTVSSQHAEIVFREGAFSLRDLRSRNGTFVNGKQISHPEEAREVILRTRDRIRFDVYEYEFTLEALAGAAQTRLAGPAVAQPPEDLRTKQKADMCPRHPAWKATELCGECQTAYCKQCMREREGTPICVACLKKTSNSSS
jgi:hypothetical protein